LVSSEHETVIDGLRATIVIFYKEKHFLHDTELSNLLLVLGQLVRLRRKIGLTSVLETIALLIKEQPFLFSDDLEMLILKSLQDIAVDTDLATGVHDLDFSEKLEIRQATAGLAYVLFEYYSKIGKSVPDVIRAWELICRSGNEFAEIRKEWLSIDCLACEEAPGT